MANVLEFGEEFMLEGLPCVSVRFVVPEVVVTDGIDAMKQRWVDMYDRLKRFVIIVDLTHPSIISFNTAWVVPHVIEMLVRMRDRSEKQVVASGIVVNWYGKKVADGVTQLYTPTRPVFYGETFDNVCSQIEEHIRQEHVRDS